MIDRYTVQRIIDTAQIVDVVSDFVSLRRAGANYKGLCPFHDDKTPSFMVSPAKNYCKCFACGKGGSPVGFVMEIEQMTYPEALRYLAKKYSIDIEERELSDEEKKEQSEREAMFVLNDFALKFFQEQMYDTVDGRAIGLKYFRSRGFRDDIIRRFNLGFSPSRRDALAIEAQAKGYNRDLLLATGLCYEGKEGRGSLIDRFHGRVIFPIYTMGGKVAGFGGRVLDAATKGVNVKYQNSPESIIYSKRRELYGLYQAKGTIAKKDCCFLVEGYTDVMAMHQMGVENVVASSGTALTEEQIRLIHRLTQNIVVIYDGDAAGIKASQRGIDMLLKAGMNVRLLLLPDGHDPDSFARDRSQKDYQEYIANHQVDFIKFKTDLLLSEAQGDPIKLSQLTQNIVQSIATIPMEITRQFYVRQASQAMGLKEETVQKAVDTARRQAANSVRSHEAAGRERSANSVRGHEAAGRERSVSAPCPQNQDNIASQQPDRAITSSTDNVPSNNVITSNRNNVITPNQTNFITPAGDDVPPPPIPDDLPLYDLPPQELQPAPLVKLPTVGIDAQERNLMQAVVRYGDKVMGELEMEDGSKRIVTVAQYIDLSMQEDELQFESPLYRRLLDESLQGNSMAMLMAHPDPDIQALAFELGTDREQLSKMYEKQGKIQPDEERLDDIVPHLLAEYKLAIVNRRLKALMYSLRSPEVMASSDRAREIMVEMRDLGVAQRSLSRLCGDRVLNYN